MQTPPLSSQVPTPQQKAAAYLALALDALREGKPDERSELGRRWSIVITEMEKTQAVLIEFLNSPFTVL